MQTKKDILDVLHAERKRAGKAYRQAISSQGVTCPYCLRRMQLTASASAVTSSVGVSQHNITSL